MGDKVYVELNLSNLPGDKVCWSTIGGVSYRGVLKEWDNGTAIVLCTDGETRTVRGD